MLMSSDTRTHARPVGRLPLCPQLSQWWRSQPCLLSAAHNASAALLRFALLATPVLARLPMPSCSVRCASPSPSLAACLQGSSLWM